MPNQRLQYLFNQYVQGNCTPDEKRELSVLALAMQNDADVRELLDQYWNKVSAEMVMPEDRSDNILKSVLGNETNMVPGVHLPSTTLRLTKRWWWAAAAILILFATGSYFLFFAPPPPKGGVPVAATTKDVKAPETNRAMVTLADGRQVYLDSVSNGELIKQGNIKLVKLANGQIAYQTATGEIIKELKYNTLSNPRGSKVIDMTLSDGSRVWLNAGSSVTYPVAFIGNERKVNITGEAYFEVAHDKAKPFFVSKADVSVQVLGTHFNVNAYDDEQDIIVTLLEGAIRLTHKAESIILKPGQQGKILKQVQDDKIKISNNVDVDAVIAWKNGLFQFVNADIETVMRQLGRWYNLDISYEGKIPERRFEGKIQRGLNLSDVLDALAKNQVHYRIEGRKLIVTP